jgi:3,4-dihydroxy 2-butanone 4-phosphate synthase
MPEPTVTVRIKEKSASRQRRLGLLWSSVCVGCVGASRFYALILEESRTMNQPSLLHASPTSRVELALESLRMGRGILVSDDESRENEADLIFSAELLTEVQMALLIRECSGIVCLCMPEDKARALDLPPMVERNSSRYQTAFTVSIEAAYGVTTGVSARDRLQTIRVAIADEARPENVCRPGHIFPLCARPGGVLERPGHTEATVDMMRLAGLKPYGVLCGLMNPDGTMAHGQQVIDFSNAHGISMVSVHELVEYRKSL